MHDVICRILYGIFEQTFCHDEMSPVSDSVAVNHILCHVRLQLRVGLCDRDEHHKDSCAPQQ